MSRPSDDDGGWTSAAPASSTECWWNTTTFYRGGSAEPASGTAYFTTSRRIAKTYGPVSEYKLRLDNPRWVEIAEWLQYDSVFLAMDDSPIEELRENGHDGVVLFQQDVSGDVVYTVFTVDAQSAVQETLEGAGGEQ